MSIHITGWTPHKLENGNREDIPYVEVKCPMDEFENAIRKIGVVEACSWFGHDANSVFTRETIECLMERSSSGKRD